MTASKETPEPPVGNTPDDSGQGENSGRTERRIATPVSGEIVEFPKPKSTPQTRGARRLTLEDKEHIIELKRLGTPVRQIALEGGYGYSTIKKVWHTYLTEQRAERRANAGLEFEELLVMFKEDIEIQRKLAAAAFAEGRTKDASVILERATRARQVYAALLSENAKLDHVTVPTRATVLDEDCEETESS